MHFRGSVPQGNVSDGEGNIKRLYEIALAEGIQYVIVVSSH